MMRRRIHNSKYYHKKPAGQAKAVLPEAPDQDHQNLYKQLDSEHKKRKPNVDAIKQLQELTFKQRRSTIEDIKEANITMAVLEKFSFLNKEVSVSKIHCKIH